jgi:hypothetical protein
MTSCLNEVVFIIPLLVIGAKLMFMAFQLPFICHNIRIRLIPAETPRPSSAVPKWAVAAGARGRIDPRVSRPIVADDREPNGSGSADFRNGHEHCHDVLSADEAADCMPPGYVGGTGQGGKRAGKSGDQQ